MSEGLKHCPNCKKDVQESNFTVHSVHCLRNVTICGTCEEAVLKSQYSQHVNTVHATVTCPQCDESLEQEMLFNHQREECPNRLMRCSYCELDVKALEIESHIEYCGSRTERCKGCTKYVQTKHLQFHYENDHMYLNPDDKDKADEDGRNDEEEECPICLGPITLPLALECGHVFCMVCVKGIANTTKNCAICRRDINRDMLMDIRFCVDADVIKNYVHNSKYKKNTRSKSVPSRFSRSSSRYNTTRDYDDMVSALLTNRTASSSYRYDRPSNGRTPRSYQPYCYSPSNYRSSAHIPSTTTSTSGSSSSSFNDDDCCGSSSSGSPVDKSPTNPTLPPPRIPEPVPARTRTTNSPPTPAKEITQATIQAPSRRRPTSLALSSSTNKTEAAASSSACSEEAEQHTLTQEEYDRWLAFELAKSDDSLTPAEFNQRHKNPMRRCFSMPESKEPRSLDSPTSTPRESSTNATDSSPNTQNGLPPVSPRSSTSHSSIGASRATLLTKSSSESSATASGNNIGNATGARPKSSTGLKKRVSFKENSPPRRPAPVMLPCEFCNETFCERDLMRHQTSCDFNETKNPKEYLLSRRSSAASPLTSPTTEAPSSPLSSSRETAREQAAASSASEILPSSISNVSPTTCGPASKPPAAPSSRNVNGLTRSLSSRSKIKLMKQSPTQSPTSPINSSFSEGYQSNSNSRNASISPGPDKSANSSGIGSANSSGNNSSTSTPPSNSSSTSPVPAERETKSKEETQVVSPVEPEPVPEAIINADPVKTPESPVQSLPETPDEDAPFPKPRKGKLLCSAISSWRSIAASRPSSRNSRGSTTPLREIGAARCLSAPLFQSKSPAIERRPLVKQEAEIEDRPVELFIRNKKSYKAPSPPTHPTAQPESQNEDTADQTIVADKIEPIVPTTSQPNNKAFRFDSMPLMNGSVHIKDDISDVCSNKSEDPSEEDSVEYNPFYYCRDEDEEIVSPSALLAKRSLKATLETKNESIQTEEAKKLSTIEPKKVEVIPQARCANKVEEYQSEKRTAFDKKIDRSSNSSKSEIELFPCSHCDKMFQKEKLHDHKKACRKSSKKKSDKRHTHDKTGESGSPAVVRRNKKGPAPQPPSSTEDSNYVEPPAIVRSNSVREQRSSYTRYDDSEGFGGRIERTGSIKEPSSRYSRMSEERSYLSRRWMSRDSIYGGATDTSAMYSSNGSLTSSTTSLSSLANGRGWSSHINMLRDDFRSRRATTSLGLSVSTAPYAGLSYRERSLSRSRPSSLYSSSSYYSRLCA